MPDLVYSGNEVRIVIGGVEVELAQNIRLSDGYGHEGISGIGSIKVQGFSPSQARHTATMSKLTMKRELAIRAGIILENGDDAMRGQEFDIEVFEKIAADGTGGGLIRKLIGCVNEGGDLTVHAHRLIMTDATFVGRDARGELATRA